MVPPGVPGQPAQSALPSDDTVGSLLLSSTVIIELHVILWKVIHVYNLYNNLYLQCQFYSHAIGCLS